jgi:DNA invertase Pin-like site-specific DNA recombinase
MIERVYERGDFDAIVVHKRDRFYRNAAKHLTVRAVLRKKGVQLHAVVNKLEENAAGWLAEGIEALVSEYHSKNLSSEVKKGLRQKERMGGWTHRAPIGYVNKKVWEGTRRMAWVEIDPERGRLVTEAFSLYASGEYTLDQLTSEMEHRGLTMRPWSKRPARPVSLNGIRYMLANKFYIGIIDAAGAEHTGRHEALIDHQTFHKVQDLLDERGGVPGVRQRRHHHYLKGLIYCGVCGRGLSYGLNKGGRYEYFFCLGRHDPRRPTGCQEKYIPVVDLETEVEQLYQGMQLRPEIANRLRHWLGVELASREERSLDEREFQTKHITSIGGQRRKLLEAYYGGAVDVAMLREEQERLGREQRQAQERLARVDATLAQWQGVFDLATRLATHCGDAYKLAKPPVRTLFNRSVFERLTVRNGRIEEVGYAVPFELVFGGPKFEQEDLERETGIEPATASRQRAVGAGEFHLRR